nr:hypothetical protein Iba_scaffold11619CG0120 [Ipomoea batatas]
MHLYGGKSTVTCSAVRHRKQNGGEAGRGSRCFALPFPAIKRGSSCRMLLPSDGVERPPSPLHTVLPSTRETKRSAVLPSPSCDSARTVGKTERDATGSRWPSSSAAVAVGKNREEKRRKPAARVSSLTALCLPKRENIGEMPPERAIDELLKLQPEDGNGSLVIKMMLTMVMLGGDVGIEAEEDGLATN